MLIRFCRILLFVRRWWERRYGDAVEDEQRSPAEHHGIHEEGNEVRRRQVRHSFFVMARCVRSATGNMTALWYVFLETNWP